MQYRLGGKVDMGEAMIRRGELIRLEFLKLGGAGLSEATLLGATGCGGGSGAMSESLVFVSWGGSYQGVQEKAWIQPFRKEVDIAVGTVSPTNYAKPQSMVESRQVVQDGRMSGAISRSATPRTCWSLSTTRLSAESPY